MDMFTFISMLGALALVYFLARKINRENDQERRASYDHLSGEELRNKLLLHIRQDVKLIAHSTFGIIIMLGFMLGIIVDRIH